MVKIKLDGKKHRVLVEELVYILRAGADVLPDLKYEYKETKVCKCKNGVPTTTEKVKQLYIFKASEEDFVKFINELIDGGILEIETGADFKILKLEVFGKNTIAAHTSNNTGFITFTINDFLSAYKFCSCWNDGANFWYQTLTPIYSMVAP